MNMPSGHFSSLLEMHRSLVIAAAAALPLAACAMLSAFRENIANTNAALALVLLIVAAAATGIRPAGLLAAVSSAAWFDFFLTQPYNQFAISKQADIETAALLVLVGAAVTEIALWGRRQQAHASREQGYLDGVLTTAAAVGAGESPADSLITLVEDQITALLGIDNCRYDTGSTPVLANIDNQGAVSYNRHPVDVRRLGLPTDTEIALPVRSQGAEHGRFLLTAASGVVRPSAQQLRVAAALANQVGAALASNIDQRRPRATS